MAPATAEYHPSRSSASGRFRFAVGAAVVGGVLVSAGALLDWSGVSYSSRVDRGIALAAGLLLIVLALAAAALAGRPRLLAIALLPAAVAMNMGVVNHRDVAGRRYEFEAYPEAAVGVGIYLILAGAILASLAGIVALATKPPRG